MESKRYTEVRDSKIAERYNLKGIELYRITLANKAKANTIAIVDVPRVWRTCSRLKRGNLEKLEALIDACVTETLERRADAAFGKIRSEEERNERMAVRMKGKVARRHLTDAIKDYVRKHNKSENYVKFIFSNCSDHLNKIILGAKAKQAKDFYQLPESSILRNHIPVDALRELELTEEMARRLIDERDVEPLEAVKQACVLCFTKSVGLN